MATRNMSESIALSTTAQDLYTLLAAINPNAPRNVCMVEIQGTDGMTDVYIGYANVSSTDYGMKISSAGDFYRDHSENKNAIALNQIYLRAASATPQVNVRVRVF
jgi:hypothetical protein